MEIRGMKMKAVARYKSSFGKRKAYIVHYKKEGTENDEKASRWITATIVANKTGKKYKHLCFGVDEEGLKELNRVVMLDDKSFNIAKANPKYFFT